MLELERDCRKCQGWGWLQKPGGGDACPDCKGAGRKLTEDGKVVANLIERLSKPLERRIKRIDEDLSELRGSRR